MLMYIFVFLLGGYGIFVFLSKIYVKYKDMQVEIEQEEEIEENDKEDLTRKEKRKLKKAEKKKKRKEKIINRKFFRIDERLLHKNDEDTNSEE